MVCLGVLRSRECITYCWGIKDCLCLSCIWWPQNLLSLLYSEGQAFLFLLWLQYLLPQGKVGADMRTVSSQDQQSTMKLKCSILMSASLASSWEVRAGRVGTVSWGHQGVLTWASANVSFVSNDHNSGFFGFFFLGNHNSLHYSIVELHTHTTWFPVPTSQLSLTALLIGLKILDFRCWRHVLLWFLYMLCAPIGETLVLLDYQNCVH